MLKLLGFTCLLSCILFIYYVCVQVREEATEVSPSTISPQGRQSALQWRRHTQSNLIQHRLLAFRSYMFA